MKKPRQKHYNLKKHEKAETEALQSKKLEKAVMKALQQKYKKSNKKERG